MAPRYDVRDRGETDLKKARWKKNYDARLQKQSELIRVDDYMYLRVERKNLKQYRLKRAPIAEES